MEIFRQAVHIVEDEGEVDERRVHTRPVSLLYPREDAVPLGLAVVDAEHAAVVAELPADKFSMLRLHGHVITANNSSPTLKLVMQTFSIAFWHYYFHFPKAILLYSIEYYIA